MMEALLSQLVIIALLSTAVTYVCHKIKIPPIVGFLITGVLFGPSALELVKDKETVEVLAEIGVVFLLFTIGLEISITELIRLRRAVFIGGTLQVALTIGIFWFLAQNVWHEDTGSDLFIGFLIALSSTAIVLKTMQEKAMMESPAGRNSLSILVYQDLVIVPMMLSIPLLAGRQEGSTDMLDLIFAAGKMLGLVISVFLLARKLVPWLLRCIINTKSRELFLISIIGICLGTAYFTSELGLSLSLGAFMAGLVVAESEYSHSALEGILPFKDVFTSVFFISVGMLLDLGYFMDNIVSVAVATMLVLGLKTMVAAFAVFCIGYPIRTAMIVGFSICQVGEFSFVLAKVGLGYSLLTPDHYQLFLAASILSMTATPFLISAAPSLAGKMFKKKPKPGQPATQNDDEEGENNEKLSDHLIILGYGVGGKLVARSAKMASIPYVILEMNPDTVRTYAAQGEPIHYGDAIHPQILRQLGVMQARVLAIVVSDPVATRSVTEIARHMNPNLHIIARTRFLGEVEPLKKLGASDVIPEEFEASIEIFIHILSRYLVSHGVIERFTQEVRAEKYAMLRSLNLPRDSINTLQAEIPDLTVSVYSVEEGSPLEGVSLIDAALRQRVQTTVVAVKRGDEVVTSPGGDFCFAKDDTVYIFSTPKAAVEAALLFQGPNHTTYSAMAG